MRRRLIACLLLAAAVVFGPAREAAAQQTLNFSLGYFTLKGEDARVDDDVINENLTFLAFDLSDFNGPALGAEWLVPIGEYLEGGAGISFTRRTVPSVYQGFVESDGSEIEQELRLRRVPIDFTVRVLPLGQSNAFQPYFGAGLSVINWRYSEFGDFIDFNNNEEIFSDQFVADGNATGPVVLGGLRYGGDTWSAGGEVRFYSAEGDLTSDFAGSTIDLGGWTYNFTVGVRFGR
jgi:hypothetical protein